MRFLRFFGFGLLFTTGWCRAQLFTVSTAAGNYLDTNLSDEVLAVYSGLVYPQGLAMDAAGNLYIADGNHSRVRKVSASGLITTVAGGGSDTTPGGYSGDGGPATSATLGLPAGVAIDSAGNLYIADFNNAVVRKVAPGGIISTYAGNGLPGYGGDGGPAVSARLDQPRALAVDSSGNLYIADYGENRIREVTPSGTISTFAGSGVHFGSSGEGGPATQAGIDGPTGLVFDTAGNLYVAASGDYVVRKISTAGIITTVAGVWLNPGYAGDGGPATKAQLTTPTGVALDSAGTLYVSDPTNNVIRQVLANGTIRTVAGTGVSGYSGDGGPALEAEFSSPVDLLSANGKVYVSDRANGLIRLLTGPPAILPGGVAPLFSTASTIQPGSWVSIYGNNLVAGPQALSWNGNYPTTLGGTSVSINNKPAYLSYVSAGLINLEAPDDATRGMVNVTVTTANGSVTGTVTLADQSPAFDLLGDGKHAAAIILRSDGSGAFGGGSYDVVGPAGAALGYPTVGAKAGDSIVIFGLGFGPVNPAVPAGQPFSGAAAAVDPVNLMINGQTVTPSFVGESAPGLFQFNVTIPAGLGAGDLPLLATVNGLSTQANVVITLQ